MSPPANDDFANAQIITGASGTVTGTNVDSTLEGGEPPLNAGSGGRTIWYKWVAPATGDKNLNTYGSRQGADNLDTVLAVYTGTTLADLVLVTFNDDTDDPAAPSGEEFTSWLIFHATSGTTYWIRVKGYGDSDQGDVVLNWANAAPFVPSPTIRSVTSPVSEGCAVTILGNNLSGATSVTFNGHAALRFVVVDDRTIIAVPPVNNWGHAFWRVTTPGGVISGTSSAGSVWSPDTQPTYKRATYTGHGVGTIEEILYQQPHRIFSLKVEGAGTPEKGDLFLNMAQLGPPFGPVGFGHTSFPFTLPIGVWSENSDGVKSLCKVGYAGNRGDGQNFVMNVVSVSGGNALVVACWSNIISFDGGSDYTAVLQALLVNTTSGFISILGPQVSVNLNGGWTYPNDFFRVAIQNLGTGRVIVIGSSDGTIGGANIPYAVLEVDATAGVGSTLSYGGGRGGSSGTDPSGIFNGGVPVHDLWAVDAHRVLFQDEEGQMNVVQIADDGTATFGPAFFPSPVADLSLDYPGAAVQIDPLHYWLAYNGADSRPRLATIEVSGLTVTQIANSILEVQDNFFSTGVFALAGVLVREYARLGEDPTAMTGTGPFILCFSFAASWDHLAIVDPVALTVAPFLTTSQLDFYVPPWYEVIQPRWMVQRSPLGRGDDGWLYTPHCRAEADAGIGLPIGTQIPTLANLLGPGWASGSYLGYQAVGTNVIRTGSVADHPDDPGRGSLHLTSPDGSNFEARSWPPKDLGSSLAFLFDCMNAMMSFKAADGSVGGAHLEVEFWSDTAGSSYLGSTVLTHGAGGATQDIFDRRWIPDDGWFDLCQRTLTPSYTGQFMTLRFWIQNLQGAGGEVDVARLGVYGGYPVTLADWTAGYQNTTFYAWTTPTKYEQYVYEDTIPCSPAPPAPSGGGGLQWGWSLR